jgi:hypothetical protein
MLGRMSRTAPLVLMLSVLLGGCNLISSDVTTFSLSFPRKDFRIDSADWHLPGTATVPRVPCAIGCAAAASSLCGSSCRADCDTSSDTCVGTVPVALRQDFNLATEAPEYKAISDQPFVSVTVDNVYFDIAENTFNVATPPLRVYLAPTSVQSVDDPAAELVGTLPSIAPRAVGRNSIVLSPGGRLSVKHYMDDFHTPFRVLIAADVTLKADDEVPSGRMVGAVLATARAGLN